MKSVTERRSLPVRRPDLRLEGRDGGRRLVDPRGERTYALNATALALWELCDGATKPDEMVEAICELFAVDSARAAADVERTLEMFTKAGLIEWRDNDNA